MKSTPAKSLIVVLALAAAGCAGHSMPAEELAAARSAVAVASHAPSPELHRAAAKLELARRFTDARDFGPARWLAEQAEVDAELAAARATTVEAQVRLAQLGEAAAVRRTAFRPQ